MFSKLIPRKMALEENVMNCGEDISDVLSSGPESFSILCTAASFRRVLAQ